jgi:hypothetical protein
MSAEQKEQDAKIEEYCSRHVEETCHFKSSGILFHVSGKGSCPRDQILLYRVKGEE